MLIILSMLLCLLALPPFSFTLAGLACFIPLFFYLLQHRGQPALLVGGLFGLFLGNFIYLGAWSYSFNLWLSLVVIMTVGCCSIFYLLGRLTATLSWFCLGCSLLFVCFESLLQQLHLPFSWTLLLNGSTLLLQPLHLIGTLGIGILLFGFQACCASYLFSKQLRYLIIAIISLTITMSYGYWQLQAPTISTEADISVVAIQTNLPPYRYTHPEREGYLEALAQIRDNLLQQIDKTVDLVVWPEVDFAGFEFRRQHNPILDWAKQYQTAMLIASPDIDPKGQATNSIFAISKHGQIEQRHDKRYLIPWVETGLTAGRYFQASHELPMHPVSLVCVESGLPLLAPQWLSAQSSGLITIATSDAYAGPSLLPWLHFEFAKIWAIMLQKPVIRAANGGISAIFNQHGQLLDAMPIYTEGIVQARIRPNFTTSIYLQYGHWITFIIWGLSFILFIYVITSPHPVRMAVHHSIRIIIMSLSLIMVTLMVQYYYVKQQYQQQAIIPYQDPYQAVPWDFKHWQANTNEASLYSAITYILRQYGVIATPSKIANNLKEQDVKTLFANHGFKLKSAHYQQHQGRVYTPALARLKSGEFIVVMQIQDATVDLFSPWQGRQMTVTRQAFLKRWDGDIIWLTGQPKSWDTHAPNTMR